jgi:hypothetical protein
MSYTPLDDRSEKERAALSIRSGRAEDDETAAAADTSSSSTFAIGARKMNPSLSEPLTGGLNGNSSASASPSRNGSGSGQDPFFVFREDLYRKLETVDESLAEFLRIVQQTVRSFVIFSVRMTERELDVVPACWMDD